jgi:hypothetical protein
MRSTTPRRRFTRAWFPLAIMVLGLTPLRCILVPEDGYSGEREPNRPPTVQITGGVFADSVDVGNRVHFRWFGADEDGVVRHFEWAVDDTTTEGAWQRTSSAGQVVVLSATQPAQGGTATDWHTFYVRAVDDQLARSVIDQRFFNATTVAPTSRLMNLGPVDGTNWAREPSLAWLGEDLDATDPRRLPVSYEIKFVEDPDVNLADETVVRQLFEEAPNLLLLPDPDDYPSDPELRNFEEALRAWKRVPATVTETQLPGMQLGRRYIFGVRAIDEAGACEQKFTRNENWVVLPNELRLVTVVVYEPSLGSHRFDTFNFSNPWQVAVTPGQRLQFRWRVDVPARGQKFASCNYGFDIPDPEDPAEPFQDPDGLGGWAGWDRYEQTQTAIVFEADQGPVHHLYLKLRDVAAHNVWEMKCMVEIRVRELAMDRKCLIVDDQRRRPFSPWFNSMRTDDALEDAWRADVLSSLAEYLPPGEQADEFSTHPDEATSPQVVIPDELLDHLLEYQTVIWDCATADESGLQPVISDQILSRYVGAGGNLLLQVWDGVISAVVPGFTATSEDYILPHPDDVTGGWIWNGFGFLWHHLHLRGPVDKPRGEERDRDRNSLVKAVSADPNFPDLALDRVRWGNDPSNPEDTRGDRFYECLVPDRLGVGDEPWYERDEALHVLYTARCWASTGRTDLNDSPIAWRIDPALGSDPHPDYGRIVCLDFHPYYFDVQATEVAMSQALMWLMAGEE